MNIKEVKSIELYTLIDYLKGLINSFLTLILECNITTKLQYVN